MKTNENKDLQEEIAENKRRADEHVLDLSNKLKTITDRHRETTAQLNNDIKTKKQQIEQCAAQIELFVNEKAQFDNERSELQRQVKFLLNVEREMIYSTFVSHCFSAE